MCGKIMFKVVGKVSELEKTIELLEEMDDEQLQAIQTVAKILTLRKPKDNVKKHIRVFRLHCQTD